MRNRFVSKKTIKSPRSAFSLVRDPIASNACALMDDTISPDAGFKIVAKDLFVEPVQTIPTDSFLEGNCLGAVCSNFVLLFPTSRPTTAAMSVEGSPSCVIIEEAIMLYEN